MALGRCIRFRVAHRVLALPWFCITGDLVELQSRSSTTLSDAFSVPRV